MATIIYPNEKRYSGPWLIGFSELQGLAETLDQISGEMGEWREGQIQEETERRLGDRKEELGRERAKIDKYLREENYDFSRQRRGARIEFKSGKSIDGDSLKELLSEPSISDEVPVALEAHAEVVNLEYRGQEEPLGSLQGWEGIAGDEDVNQP